MLIRERVYQQMLHQGITQTELCNDLCLQKSNFNAFLRGERSISFFNLIGLMRRLRLSVAPIGKEYTNLQVEYIREYCLSRIKDGGKKLSEVANALGMDAGSLSGIVTGKRACSSKVMERILNVLGLDIVKYKNSITNQ